MSYDYDRRASADRYIVKLQEKGRPPGDTPFTTEAAAHEYAQRLIKAAPRLTYLAVEHHRDGALVEKKILKGTATSTDKKLTKLRADLAKLEQYQERAVGALNKAEFEADIEWTQREIARLSR
jgi:hypothetical protein